MTATLKGPIMSMPSNGLPTHSLVTPLMVMSGKFLLVVSHLPFSPFTSH